MRHHLLLLLVTAALCACAAPPATPVDCEGQLVPINTGSTGKPQGDQDATRPGS